MTATVDVPTEAGPGRLVLDVPRAPRAVLLLGHGAGGGLDSFDLSTLAAQLPAGGIGVVRFAQPWLVAGRKIAGPPASLDKAWAAALAVATRKWRGTPLVVGGRSAGGRVACRCFAAPAVGVLALAFPLHPPGKPEKSRRDELAAVPAPVLIVQGETDPFGTPHEIRAAIRANAGKRTLVTVNAGHSLQPAKRADPAAASRRIVDAVAGFVDQIT
ncbi:alpha/beta hydrolase family protein [Cumulibacter manganitolerans]|uniref:alpha/beta hydrolase family protein n=1 Tax=Cumulibacter manganitolerans TaxID=1884992 RepID=UPI0012966959|nr:alpha/beta family hydrolase [Cumulibacter manganitolerans]